MAKEIKYGAEARAALYIAKSVPLTHIGFG